MLTTRLLLAIFRPFGLMAYVGWLLVLGIFIVVNTLATMVLASQIGAYLALAVTIGAVWASLFLVWGSLRRHLRRIKESVQNGRFPEFEFTQLSGLLVATFLMVLPGLVTTMLAWIVYLPPLRLGIGVILVRRYRTEFTEAYQHLQAGES